MIVACNPASMKVFNSFPLPLRAVMREQLDRLWGWITSHDPGAVCTSGFRCPGYNRDIGGARNSLHQYCLAIDVSLGYKGLAELQKDSRVRVVVEGDHYHVEYAL